jgi:TolB protein
MSLDWHRHLLLCSLLCAAMPAVPETTIDVVGGEGRQIPIALLPFAGESGRAADQQVKSVVAQDLARSGWFRIVGSDATHAAAPETGAPDFAMLRNEGAQVALSGAVSENSRMLETRIDVLDVGKRGSLLNDRFMARPDRQRRTGHRIADRVHEALTGRRGAFDTRICYVARDEGLSRLVVADMDGHDPRTLYSASGPIVSPQWSPDGKSIVYVSLEYKKPVVYVHRLEDGTRKLIARFHGSNFSPAWSPDGQKLALALSKEGGSQIFVMNAEGEDLQRLVISRSRDSEPNFSPDGRRLLFSSDRSGSPQIYELKLDSQEAPRRLTFEGSYNTSPRYSPDGRFFAFVHFSDGRYNIATQDMESGKMRLITSGRDDRSPSFAPNGDAILYIAESRDGSVLSATTADGRVNWTLPADSRSLRTPAWGPFITSHSGD